MFINSEVQLLKSELTNRLILWVLHADKIPPHIGLSKNDQFYSLKVSGKDEGLPVRNVLQIIEKKNIADNIWNPVEVFWNDVFFFAFNEFRLPG